MNNHHKPTERGQMIVIVALMMIAFAAILALAIDGGLTYSQRRRAQNAADAGALAGAREMCITGGSDPVAAAKDYAARNGIGDPDDVIVTTSTVGTVNSVAVTVSIQNDTFFAGLIGIDETEVGATAEAACYPPCSGTGVLPIAWSCTPPDVGSGSVSESCDVFPHDADGCTWEDRDDDPFYIIADSDSIEDKIICTGSGGEPDPDATYVDCDPDGDGTNDVEILSGANRSWLNLDGGSSGSSEMIDWIQGQNVPDVQVHSWFAGSSGARDSVYQAVEDYRWHQYVSIPVFDMFNADLKNGDTPSPFHGNDTFLDSGAGDYFHVMTFATFYVSCVSTGTNDHCPAKDALLSTGAIKKANTKTIEGCFKQGLFEGGGRPGECTVDAGAYVLKLIR